MYRIALVLIGICCFQGLTWSQLASINAEFPIDSRILPTSGDDTLVFEYAGAEEGKKLGAFDGFERVYGYGTAEELVFSPKGDYFLVITSIGFELYSYSASRLNPSLEKRFLTKDHVVAAGFKAENGGIIVVTDSGTVQEWSLDGSNLTIIGNHGDPITTGAIGNSGRYAITAGETVKLWDLANKQPKNVPAAGMVTCVALSDNDRLIALGNMEGTITILNASSLQPLKQYRHDVSAIDVSFSHDSNYVASSGMDNFVRVMDLATGRHYWIGIHDGFPLNVNFSWNNQFLVSSGAVGNTYMWEYKEDEDHVKPIFRDSAQTPIYGSGFSQNNKFLGYIIGGYTIVFFEMDELYSQINSSDVDSAGYAPAYSIDNFNNTFSLSDDPVYKLEGYTEKIFAMELRSDYKYLVTGHGDGSVYLWDVASGKSQLLNRHGSMVLEVHFSSDGTKVVSSAADGSVKYWLGDTGLTDSISRMGTEAFCAAFDTTAQWIAAGGSNMVLLWNLRNNSVKRIALTDVGIITNIMFVNNNASLLLTTNEGAVLSLDIESENKTNFTPAHTGNVTTLYKNQKGIVTASKDKSIRSWNLESGGSEILQEDIGVSNAVKYNTDAQSFILIADGKDIYFYNLIDRQRVKLYSHTLQATTLAMESNDQVFYSGGFDGVVRVMDISKSTIDRGESRPSDRLGGEYQVEGSFLLNRMILDGNTIFLHPRSGPVTKFDKISGTVVWEEEKELSNSSPVLGNGKYYFIESRDQTMVALDAETGERLWAQTNIDVLTGGNSFAFSDGFLYISGVSKEIKKINAEDGNKVWAYNTGVTMTTTPIVHESTLYMGGDGGYFISLDIENQSEKWSFREEPRFNLTIPVYYENKIFIGKYDGSVLAIDATNGNKLASLQCGEKIMSVPTTNGKYFYISDTDGSIYKIDMMENSIVWTKKLAPDGTTLRLAADTNNLYVTNLASEVKALEIESGDEKWSFQLPNGATSPVEALSDGLLLWVITAEGTLYKLNKTILGE